MEPGLITFGVEEELLRQIQADRLKRNPTKIPFIPNAKMAEEDKTTFKYYEQSGERVIDICIRDICIRNYIDPDLISRKLFVKVANSLGFFDESDKEKNSCAG